MEYGALPEVRSETELWNQLEDLRQLPLMAESQFLFRNGTAAASSAASMCLNRIVFDGKGGANPGALIHVTPK